MFTRVLSSSKPTETTVDISFCMLPTKSSSHLSTASSPRILCNNFFVPYTVLCATTPLTFSVSSTLQQLSKNCLVRNSLALCCTMTYIFLPTLTVQGVFIWCHCTPFCCLIRNLHCAAGDRRTKVKRSFSPCWLHNNMAAFMTSVHTPCALCTMTIVQDLFHKYVQLEYCQFC